MFGDLFDSPWKLLIIAALILVLFGSRKLPGAARSLGRSMRILKHEVRGLGDDDESDGADSDREQPQAQRQIEQKPDRQRQAESLSDLQRPEEGDGAVLNGAGSAEARRTQQPS